MNATIDTGDPRKQTPGALDYPYTFPAMVISVIGMHAGGSPVTLRPDDVYDVGCVAWPGDDAVDRVDESPGGGEIWSRPSCSVPRMPVLGNCSDTHGTQSRRLRIDVSAMDELGRRQRAKVPRRPAGGTHWTGTISP